MSNLFIPGGGLSVSWGRTGSILSSAVVGLTQDSTNNGATVSSLTKTSYNGNIVVALLTLTEDSTFASIGAYLGSASTAGDEMEYVIYDVGSSGVPNNLIYSSGSVAMSTSGFKWVNETINLPAGQYFVGVLFDNGNNAVGSYSMAIHDIGNLPMHYVYAADFTLDIRGYLVDDGTSHVVGSPPSTVGSISLGLIQMPFVVLRRTT